MGIYENFFQFLKCVGKTTILMKNIITRISNILGIKEIRMMLRHLNFLIDILILKNLENIHIFRLSIPPQIMIYLGKSQHHSDLLCARKIRYNNIFHKYCTDSGIAISFWFATWPRIWLHLTSFTWLRCETAHRLQCISKLYTNYCYVFSTHFKNWGKKFSS